MPLKFYSLVIIIAFAVFTSCRNTQNDSVAQELVWSDEFNYEGAPDTTRWQYSLGNGCPSLCGWGNNELEYYTDYDENVRVGEGKLIIQAKYNPNDSLKKYTSAKLITKGKGDWKYGYIEVKAKLPEGVGTWPAIWMMPTVSKYGGWPKSGEIDIMEHVGFDQGNVLGTVHTGAFNHVIGTQQTDTIHIADASNAFHVYAIDWTPEKIDFIADGVVYNTFQNNGGDTDNWPYDEKFYLILNLAVGGNWGGKKGVDNSIWPQQMEVDYVRVYKHPEWHSNND